MPEQKTRVHTTRVTKRGGQNSRPDDVFQVEAEVSMEAAGTSPGPDGRNPAITSGTALPQGFDVPQGGR